MKNNDTNVYGQPLQVCSYKPLTGYDRTGYCSSSKNDKGKHWVCGKMDKKFLQFTKKKGNDLTSVVKLAIVGVYAKTDLLKHILIVNHLG